MSQLPPRPISEGRPQQAGPTDRPVGEPPKRTFAGELPDPRSAIGHDYARVLHSGAFRRLQAKSQVVHSGHADWFRTRLTHTLEVAQIGRDTARRVVIAPPHGMSADVFDGPLLVETAALLHDLGHPPFGHNGENELKSWMNSVGSSFEANAQSFRIANSLEVKFPPLEGQRPIGLSLTAETLAASLKYPWPQGIDEGRKDWKKFGYYASDWPYENDAARAEEALRLTLPKMPTFESPKCRHAASAVMDWADDVAYSVHDLEDGIRARMIPVSFLLHDKSAAAEAARHAIVELAVGSSGPVATPEQRGALSVAYAEALATLCSRPSLRALDAPYQHSDEQRARIKSMTSDLIGWLVEGISLKNGLAAGRTEDDLDESVPLRHVMDVLKAMNRRYVIESRELQTMQYRERRIIRALCDAFLLDGSQLLPDERKGLFDEALERDRALLERNWATERGSIPSGPRLTADERRQYAAWDALDVEARALYPKRHRARVVCDYVSGMTDRFAERSYARLVGTSPQALSDYI